MGMSEEWKKAQGERSRLLWSNPTYRNKIVNAVKIKSSSQEAREKQAKFSKSLWSDPDQRRRILERRKSSAAMEKWHASMAKSGAVKASTLMKNNWQDPTFREARATRLKEVANDPEYQQKMLDILRNTGKKILNLPKFLPEHPNARHVKLRSPDNRIWEVHNISKFVEDNLDLFDPRHREFTTSGVRKAASALRKLTGNRHKRNTSLGWTLVSDTEALHNNGEDLLNRQTIENS